MKNTSTRSEQTFRKLNNVSKYHYIIFMYLNSLLSGL